MKRELVCESLLLRFTDMSRRVLGVNLVGIYLHGSAALGCFHPKKSDLDVILIVDHDIPDEVKLEFMRQVVLLNEEAPEKGLELSIVKREFCDPFVYPTPYELHFSVTHLKCFQDNPNDYVDKMRGTDKDLAAHFTIINHCGIVLYGEDIEKVFGIVPRSDYIDSIWLDVENACEEIITNPIYVTLNLCRVLAYLRENLVLSKKEGGEWGERTLPQKFRPFVCEACRCYTSGVEMAVDLETASEFAKFMINQIKLDNL